ncbi:MAG: GGDEF domain-containing protein [Lachnospiraceae bacterium]|nr:GGDEF domain-containing protein [Lachnospiraceae bacterium]
MIEKYDSIMRGMSSIYKSIFLIDLEARSISQLDHDENTKRFFNEDENYFEILKNFLRNTVVIEHLYDALTFCDVHTIKPRLRYKNVIDSEFIGNDAGWFRAQFIVLERSEAGVPVRLVFTTQIIDDEKNAIDEQQRIIRSLADIYFTLHLFDLEKDTVTEVSTQNLIHKIHSENYRKGCQKTISAAIDQTTDEKYIDHMREFTDLSTLNERMHDKKIISTEFIGYAGWAKGSFIEVECDNSGKLKKVLYATQIIDDEKHREELLVKTALTDELTGLLNRRAYDNDIKELFEPVVNISDITLIAIDVNGLKDANDTLGHEAGDELIIGASDCLKKGFLSYGKVYRIGGDEFVAVIEADGGKIADIMQEFQNLCDSWQGKLVSGLSLSYGYVRTLDYKGYSFLEIMKEADKKMYACKEEYYKRSGNDRRRRT